MKKALLWSIMICLIFTGIVNAYADIGYPKKADALLYQNFLWGLELFEINFMDSECTTIPGISDTNEPTIVCQYKPVRDVNFEIEYKNGEVTRYSVFVKLADDTYDDNIGCMMAFSLIFIDNTFSGALDIVSSLSNNFKEENGMWVSSLQRDCYFVQMINDGQYHSLSVYPQP